MVSTAEKASAYLKQIHKHNKEYGALLHVNDHIEKEAQDIDKKIASGKGGAFAGTIFAIKSCISVQDYPVTCGSKTLEHYKGSYDADVIRTLTGLR